MAPSRASPAAFAVRQVAVHSLPHRPCRFQCLRERPIAVPRARKFSNATKLCARGALPGGRGGSGMTLQANNRHNKEFKSPRLTQQQELQEQGLRNPGLDLGIIPMTFIFPRTDAEKRPSWRYSPRDRLAMEWQRVKSYWLMFRGLIQYKAMGAKKVNMIWRTKIHKEAAEKLYKSTYTAFAEDDINMLKLLCYDGILGSFQNRLRNRPKSQKMRWEYERLGRPRIVDHRALVFPKNTVGGMKMGQRQVVVRLTSIQRVVIQEKGVEEPQSSRNNMSIRSQWRAGIGGWKKVVEYVVIQKRFLEDAEGDWRIWGMVEEHDLEDLKDLKEDQKKLENQSLGMALPSLSS